MSDWYTNFRRMMVAAVCLALSAGLIGSIGGAASGEAGGEIAQVATHQLPNVPGKSVTAIVVSYPPGGKSGKHHHAGSVLAYVLSGSIRSENSVTGPVKVYKEGESFFEPPGSTHLVSDNASATEPAKLLAIFIADDGAGLTVFDK